MKRRDILKSIPLVTLAGSIPGSIYKFSAINKSEKAKKSIDYFNELGVDKVINASATMTWLSGSLMLPEVLEAINSTAHDFADMYQLQDKAGIKIAEMLNCEAAMVTSGAACALVLGTAAAITGFDEEKRKLIPNLPGERPEVIMQTNHRYVFDQAITTTGAKIIEVNNEEEMRKAFNKNTVMALFFNAAESWYGVKNTISHEKFVAICKEHNVPSFIDAAADVPPVENLFKYQKMGFDLVTFSGGKMIRGPQSAGLLFGKESLIEAAKLNYSPHEAPIGRPMKVNKEEIFGMYAALKIYLEKDHDKEWQDWMDRTSAISTTLDKVDGVKTEVIIPEGPANVFPTLDVTWDTNKIKITGNQLYEKLKSGTPSIVTSKTTKNNKQFINVGVVLLKPEQVSIVANQIKKELQSKI
ncbi:aminotransferase class V-fold PLP-dependent enzyme [Zunongwangia atlantica]|uniref:Selenocysteine synthase (Seryl-tRNASer selenium transferase) n=1 Tax=Zunongwangia atlantica 22II14-10F7 TaxID=1185767 RepID=A0A1Y1SZP7_9FLAO|nr:aminotransferase class V-fold PLP-dependent enzyme [Zunongwangia atlantica]ORL44042.1 selenocysteine synthase (seryl-tRNASer selenium transferase) [Zunongwangia atlantica 22II14-10F7]